MWNEVCYVSTYVSRAINRPINIWERFKMIKLLPLLRGLRDKKTEKQIEKTSCFDIELQFYNSIQESQSTSLILLPKSFSLCSRTLILIFFKSQ